MYFKGLMNRVIKKKIKKSYSTHISIRNSVTRNVQSHEIFTRVALSIKFLAWFTKIR